MAHHSHGAEMTSRLMTAPRGLIVAVFAAMSWALVLAAGNAISLSFHFLLGA